MKPEPLKPSRSAGPYANEPMTRDRAFDVAIAFGLEFNLPCTPRENGEGYDALIPMELVEHICSQGPYLTPPRTKASPAR